MLLAREQAAARIEGHIEGPRVASIPPTHRASSTREPSRALYTRVLLAREQAAAVCVAIGDVEQGLSGVLVLHELATGRRTCDEVSLRVCVCIVKLLMRGI